MFLSTSIITLASSLLSLTSATSSLEPRHDKQINGAFTFQIHSLDNYWVPSSNIRVDFVLQLRRKPGAQPVALRYLQQLRGGKHNNGVFGQEEIDVTDTGMPFHSLKRPHLPPLPSRTS